MTIDPVALLRRYHTALNAYDARTVAPMFAVDAVYVSPGVSGRIAPRVAPAMVDEVRWPASARA